MTEPLPENVRQAGYDALEELAARTSRSATNLSKQAMRLRLDDPKNHRMALRQLRRYQTERMPGFEEVGVIEGGLMGLTEPESRALSERRRLEKSRQERAGEKAHAEWLEERWQQGGSYRREAVRRALSRAELLVAAASHVEKNAGSVELAKALAACMDAWWPGGDPYCVLASKLGSAARAAKPEEEIAKPRQDGNVVDGPWAS
jgi:hypothetical protein